MNSNHKQNVNVKIQSENDFPFGWLIIGILAFIASFSTIGHGQTAVRKVESVGFTVSDMDRAINFYTQILPFEKVSDKEVWGEDFEHLSGVFGARVRVVRLKLGSEMLELTEYLNSTGRPIPIDSRSNDKWFQHIAIIVSDMDKAFEVLRKNKVRFASTAPQTLPKTIPNAAGIRAFYFKDFDNHILEILQFPEDKGSKKWHEPARDKNNLFLGIDHTAIVINDTVESLKFYRDVLGLTVAGESMNFGMEQEHLNNVFGAKLHITNLGTKDDGIHVEFLEYLAPRDGKPFPQDTRSSDLWHWQTSFSAQRPEDLSLLLSRNRFDFISSGEVAFQENTLGFDNSFLVRDPDGHAVRVVGRFETENRGK